MAPIGDLAWLHQRIVTWLAQAKWVDQLEEDAATMVLADWEELLRPFPKWAIAKAARAEMSRSTRFAVADAVAACTREVADPRVELDALQRLIDPRQQERARARREEREAENRREAERLAYVEARRATDCDWSPVKEALERVLRKTANG